MHKSTYYTKNSRSFPGFPGEWEPCVGGGHGRLAGDTDGLAGDGGRGRSGRGQYALQCQPARSWRWTVQVHTCVQCTQGLAGRGDWCQWGLDWGRSDMFQYTELPFCRCCNIPWHFHDSSWHSQVTLHYPSQACITLSATSTLRQCKNGKVLKTGD